MKGDCFNGVYLFLMMCCIPISLLQIETDDKEGRNYTVMQIDSKIKEETLLLR